MMVSIKVNIYNRTGAHTVLKYEADEAARCMLAGELESEGLPWVESTLIMEIMDELRKQDGLKYPDAIESMDYPVKLTSKASYIP